MKPFREKGRTVLKCSCGHKTEGEIKISEGVKEEERRTGVVETEAEVHARTEAECPKCGNKEAFAWEVQTRAADEPATRFFKCTKCERTWREYR